MAFRIQSENVTIPVTIQFFKRTDNIDKEGLQ